MKPRIFPFLVSTLAPALLVLSACGGSKTADETPADTVATPAPAEVAPLPVDSMVRVPVEPPLEETRWVLFEIPGENPPPPGVDATLEMVREGEVLRGSTGCRAYTGSYSLTGPQIELALSSLGGGSCTQAGASVEADYLGALRNVGSWRLKADTLELLGEQGVLARFTAPEGAR